MKDGSLYIKIFDDRFAYFYTYYANSYFLVQHLKVEGDKLVLSNGGFEEEYIAEAVECESSLSQQLEEELGDFEMYSPLLVCITVNYMMAGQEEKAWQKFEEYSSKVPLDYIGGEVSLDEIKKDFIELYQMVFVRKS